MRSIKTHLPGSPGAVSTRVGQSAAVYGTDAPSIPPLRAGEECNEDYPGLGNRSVFYPCSSVGKRLHMVRTVGAPLTRFTMAVAHFW